MEPVGATLWLVFVATVASKPVCLNVGEDSSSSLESSESDSSEETTTHFGPSQSQFTETDALEASRPSLATLDTSALPSPEDPQTSTNVDALHLMPEDPCQTAPGGETSLDVCNSEPPGDFIEAGTSTKTPDITGVFHGFPQDATPPFPLQVITPAPRSFATDSPLTIPIGATLTGAPVCFTIQLTTPEPAPPRGDSI